MRRLLLVCPFILVVTCHLSGQTGVAVAETAQTRFELRAHDCNLCDRQQYVVRAVDKATGRAHEMVIPSQALQPIQLHVAFQKLVLIGEPRGGGQTIEVLNAVSLRKVDTIWCYQSALSPSGRFIAYVQHYPRFLPAGQYPVENIMVYDFASSPEASRVSPAPHEDPRSVGWPVFRPVKSQRPYEFTTGNRELSGYLTLRPPSWHTDRFLLFTYWLPSAGNQLVLIDLGQGVQHARNLVVSIAPETVSEVTAPLREPVAFESIRIENGSVTLTTARQYAGIDGVNLRVDLASRFPNLRGL